MLLIPLNYWEYDVLFELNENFDLVDCLKELLHHNLFYFPRASSSYCTPAADCCWSNLPLDPAERQLHQRGWTNHWPAGGVPYGIGDHVWPAARRQDHAQDRPPGSRHRVRDQCSADQTSGGRDRSSWPPSESQNQVCRWDQNRMILRKVFIYLFVACDL